MSIRALALDLYRARQTVERLEKNLGNASQNEKTELEQELKIAQKELHLLRRMLDGEKESGIFRKRFGGFGRAKR